MTSSYTIHGAGLLGSLLAWRLARQGFRVTVIERSSEQQPAAAAYTAAAMIAPWAERHVCTEEMFQRGLASLALWPQLLSELEQETGMAVDYQCRGSLVVAHPADRVELQQFISQLRFYGLQPGTCAQVQQIGQAELMALEPALNPAFEQAIWLPQEAHLHQRMLLPALWAAARQAGADMRFDTPASAVPVDGFLLDCRGTGAAQDIPQLRAVRGEVLWIESDLSVARPLRLLHPRYHLYLVPKGKHQGRYRYLLGATEIESDDRSPVSVRSAMELLSALYCLIPAFSEARIVAFDSNCRPALPDHCPAVIPLADGHGLRINGLFRHGYLQAPALLKTLDEQGLLPLAMPELHPQEAVCASL